MAKNVKISRSSESGKFVTVASGARNPSNHVERVGTSRETSVTVRDSKTGQILTVKGAGALKDSQFAIKKSVDLTKPIAEQALRGSKRTG